MKRQRFDSGGMTAYYVIYYAMVAAMVATALWPVGRSWGINWFVYFTRPTLVLSVAAALLFPLALQAVRRRATGADGVSGSKIVYAVWSAAVMLLGALFFYLLRCETHFFGDGYLLISKLEGAMELPSPLQYGPRQLQELLYSLFSGVEVDRAQFVFRVISWGCGLTFLAFVLWVSQMLFSGNFRRALFAVGMATGGYMLLFFGYVENYPPFVLGVALFGLVGLLASRGTVSRWWVLVTFLLAGFFHVFAVALVPAVVYLLLQGTAAGEWIGKRRSLMVTVLLALVAVAAASAVYLFRNDFSFRLALVPPVQDIFTVGGYTLFSPAHLLDWTNLLIMLLPAVFFVPILLFSIRRAGLMARPDYLFLLLMLLPSLLLTFVIDPKLGMPRDWDLFSFAGVPLALLLYYGLLDEAEGKKYWQPAVLAIALGLLILGPRVISQHDIIKSINVFDRVTAPDILRTRSVQAVLYDLFERTGDLRELSRRRAEYERERPDLAWLDHAIELGRHGRFDDAAVELRRVIAFNPSHSAAWSNLGTYFQRRGQNDSALYCFEVADALTPHNAGILDNMGIVYYSMRNFEEAERCWTKSIALDPMNYHSRENLLKLYQTQNRNKEYLEMSFQIFEIGMRSDAPLPFIQKLAELHMQRSDFDQAAEHYRRALARGLDSAVVRALEGQYPQLHVFPREP